MVDIGCTSDILTQSLISDMSQSIDLTQLPAVSTRNDSNTGVNEPAVEYSSREVSPPALLIQQLVRAHAVFLLHHGTTLGQLFAKHKRDKFCSILDKYWARFASNWDVLLHGSPAVDIFSGLKLAAGGELGMGVGEEDWGSSERDVLEDFARRTNGLVDVMVSRFGEPSPFQKAKSSTDPKKLEAVETESWIGSGRNPDAPDGVVFSGLGALSRKSLRDVSHWIETIYSIGDQAYGVRDNPTSNRTKRKRRNRKPSVSPARETPAMTPKDKSQVAASSLDDALPRRIPPPIVKAVENSLDKASAAADSGDGPNAKEACHPAQPLLSSLGDTETWMKYMTLGYSSGGWGGRKPTAEPQTTKAPVKERSPSPEAMRYIDPTPDVNLAEEKLKQQIRQENDGYFIIGLKGDMDDVDVDDDNDEGDWNLRIPLRTLHVEVIQRDDSTVSQSGGDSDVAPIFQRDLSSLGSSTRRSDNGLSRLRPVVYVVSRAPDYSLTSAYVRKASSFRLYLFVQPPDKRPQCLIILSRYPQFLLSLTSFTGKEHICCKCRSTPFCCVESIYHNIGHSRCSSQPTANLRSGLRPSNAHGPFQSSQHTGSWLSYR